MSPKPLTNSLTFACTLFAFCAAAGLAAAANKPQVVSATVDFAVGYGQLTLVGENLPSSPGVRLGGTLLDVLSNSPTEIVASLQAVAGIQNLPGDYQLSISQGNGASNVSTAIRHLKDWAPGSFELIGPDFLAMPNQMLHRW